MRVDLPTGSIAFRERGGGLPLALLHAFPLSSEMWEPQLAALSDVAQVVAPDMRGFGQTPYGGSYSLADLARDLAAVMEALGHPRFFLGGLSMGGYVAFAFEQLFGDRLLGLVLADTKAAADAPAARDRRYQTALDVEAHGTAALAQSMPGTLLAPSSSTDLQRQVRTWIEQADPRAVAAAQRAMAERPDSSDRLPKIQVPTLVIVGEQDALSPPEEAERMASLLRRGRLVRVPKAGHLSNLENPGTFNLAVRDFLAEHAP